jgi:predicted transcriptional regulator
MEVHFSEDVQAKLIRLASEQGRDAETFVREVVERAVNHDDWFLQEVEKGMAVADNGEFIEHEEVLKLINSRYPG